MKLHRWESARSALNACLARRPEFVWGYLFRSYANEELSAIDDSEADFARALSLDPNDFARYLLFLLRGTRRFYQKSYDQAIADFEAARKLKPDDYHAYLNLAQVALARRNFAQADEQWRLALSRQPPREVIASFHIERARNLCRAAKHEEAVNECDAALRVDPGHCAPHELRGRALFELGRWEEAERAFDLSILKSDKSVPVDLDIYRARGQARMKRGRYPEAAEDYTRVIERSPDSEIYQHRGWAHFFCDAWKLALRDFARAIDLDADDCQSYIGRGLARVMLGDYREAVADAEKALASHPNDPTMRFNIACIYAQAAARVTEKPWRDSQQTEQITAAEHYRKRAFDSLRETLRMIRPEERLAYWNEKVIKDLALAPLRGSNGLDQLQKEVYSLPSK